MPRVLRIINRFNLGGPTYNAAYLSRYLPSPYQTKLIGGQKDAGEDNSIFILGNLGVEPEILPEMRRSISLLNDIRAYRKIKKIIEEFKPDIVHTHASKSGALGRIAAYKAGVPVIVHTFHGHIFHGYFNSLITFLYKKLERYVASKSTAIVAISEIQKKELTQEHKISTADKVFVVPLGFDLEKFQENIPLKRKQFRETFKIAENVVAIGIVGRLVPIKNHSMFLRIISKVISSVPDYRIRAFIVGDGPEKGFLKKTASSLNLKWAEKPDEEADVIFTSWIKNIDYLNAGMDIIALTSRNEGTPVSLIEAQATNKPIVTTRVGGIEDIVAPDETAFLADLFDEKTFQDHLIKLITNPSLRIKMGEKGWDHVKNKFTYQRLTKDIHQLYEQLLQRQ